MTEFEFLSVLISMIFGLGVTHVLAGAMHSGAMAGNEGVMA